MEKPIPTPVRLDAHQLRRLAEAAASRRGPKGDPYDLVEREDHTLELVHRDPDGPFPLGTIIEANTRSVQPNRPQVTDVIIGTDEVLLQLAGKYDAVFWTEAAVEKFVFPYLASESMWSAAYYVTELSRAWYGYIPSPDPTTGAGEEPIPFAIGHTPNSEFTVFPEEPGRHPHHLHVLFKEGDRVYARSLAELIAEREATDRGTADPETRTPASPDGA